MPRPRELPGRARIVVVGGGVGVVVVPVPAAGVDAVGVVPVPAATAPVLAARAAPPAAGVRLRDPGERWFHLIIVSRFPGGRP